MLRGGFPGFELETLWIKFGPKRRLVIARVGGVRGRERPNRSKKERFRTQNGDFFSETGNCCNIRVANPLPHLTIIRCKKKFNYENNS